MTIFDEARKGTLKATNLTYDELNSHDPNTGWTLLATSAVSGYPQQVNELLKRGAKATIPCKNDETALLLTAWKTQRERALILQKILQHLNEKETKVHIDKTCNVAEHNTPLMCAIGNSDVDSIRLLVKAGASLTEPNEDGFNAVDVAKNTGNRSLQSALKPEAEQNILMLLSSGVLKFMRHVVSRINDMFTGAVSQVFGIKGKRNEVGEKMLRKGRANPGEPTHEEFIERVDDCVKGNPMLNTFFEDKPEFIQDVAKKVMELAKDTSSVFGSEELRPKAIEVTLHQQVIYCDDSGSMINPKGRTENRWPNQKELAERIAKITTQILPDGEGVALRFINHVTEESPNLLEDGIHSVLDSITPNPRANTALGTTLRERILEPMVYGPLRQRMLKRPLLISILTDGGPSDKDTFPLVKVITQCGDELEKYGRPRESVKFLIGQIGSSKEAVEFLKELRDARQTYPSIARVLYVYAGRLDDEFKEDRDERKLDRWLIETLWEPLRLGRSI